MPRCWQPGLIFMQDNASIYKIYTVKQWFQDIGICQVSFLQSGRVDHAMAVQQECKGSWGLAGGSLVICKVKAIFNV